MPHPGSYFTLSKTRMRVCLLVSLILVWSLALLVPHYKPIVEAEVSMRLQEARMNIPSVRIDWKAKGDPRARYNSTKLALLIESRPIPHLVPLLLHMISVVSQDWRFLYIGSELSVLAGGRSSSIKHQQAIGKLNLMILPEPWSIKDREQVSRLMSDSRFYDELLPGVEWILKYEHDSILCANSEDNLNNWLDWSWAGSPRTVDDHFPGSGGLSLRRVSAIKRVLSFQARYNDTDPEDVWFGKRLAALPGEKIGTGFDGALAVENVYMDNPIGYHVPGGSYLSEQVWKDPRHRRKILEYCPEISMIMDMKLERERCPDDNWEGGRGPTDEERTRQANEEAQQQQTQIIKNLLEHALSQTPPSVSSTPSAVGFR